MHRITEECVMCGTCLHLCPVRAIVVGSPYFITSRCNDCGVCAAACPVDAIVTTPKTDS